MDRLQRVRHVHRESLGGGRGFQDVAAEALYLVDQPRFVEPQNRVVVHAQAFVFRAEPLVLGLLFLKLHPQVGNLLRESLKLLDRLLSVVCALFLRIPNLKRSEQFLQFSQTLR